MKDTRPTWNLNEKAANAAAFIRSPVLNIDFHGTWTGGNSSQVKEPGLIFHWIGYWFFMDSGSCPCFSGRRFISVFQESH